MAAVAAATRSHHSAAGRDGPTRKPPGTACRAGRDRHRLGYDVRRRSSSPSGCRPRPGPTRPTGRRARRPGAHAGRNGSAPKATGPHPGRPTSSSTAMRRRATSCDLVDRAPAARLRARPVRYVPARRAPRRDRRRRGGRRRRRGAVSCATSSAIAGADQELGDAPRQQPPLGVGEAGVARSSRRGLAGSGQVGDGLRAGTGRRPGPTAVRRSAARPCRSRARAPGAGAGSRARPPRAGRSGPGSHDPRHLAQERSEVDEVAQGEPARDAVHAGARQRQPQRVRVQRAVRRYGRRRASRSSGRHRSGGSRRARALGRDPRCRTRGRGPWRHRAGPGRRRSACANRRPSGRS